MEAWKDSLLLELLVWIMLIASMENGWAKKAYDMSFNGRVMDMALASKA